MDEALQALCFAAGANSIFYGDKLLTVPNPQAARDRALFDRLGHARRANTRPRANNKADEGRAAADRSAPPGRSIVDAAFLADPYPIYAELREAGAIHWSDMFFRGA
jgi:hypothetical protein